MKLKLKRELLACWLWKRYIWRTTATQSSKFNHRWHTSKFPELTIRSQVMETETVARFKAGLRAEIRKELLTTRLVSVDEAYQLALKVENQFKWLSVWRTNHQVGNNSGCVTRNGAIRVKKFNSPQLRLCSHWSNGLWGPLRQRRTQFTSQDG